MAYLYCAVNLTGEWTTNTALACGNYARRLVRVGVIKTGFRWTSTSYITPTVAAPHHAYRRGAGRPHEVVEAAPAPRTTAA